MTYNKSMDINNDKGGTWMKDLNKEFSSLPWHKKIKVLRTMNDLTQDEVAEKCFTTQKGYWSWESGNSYPRKISRNALASAFGVKVNDIFSDIDKETSLNQGGD